MENTSNIHLSEVTEMTPETLEALSALLIEAVTDGASLGFIAPLEMDEAQRYWQQVLEPGVILWTVKKDGVIAGTVQLQLAMKKNGSHRAEVTKLMIRPQSRRSGMARLLMQAVEERAKLEGRTLLVLDTREGDPSNQLYKSLGYIESGRIPEFARSSNGKLDATILYYKML